MRVLFGFTLAAFVLGCSSAYAAECVGRNSPLVKMTDAPEVRTYECAGPSGKGAFRITYLRLTEGLVGSLAKQERLPELDLLFGGPPIVVKNKVFGTLETLFRKFGYKSVYPADMMRFSLNLRGPLTDKRTQWQSFDLPRADGGGGKYRLIWTVTRPFGFGEYGGPVISLSRWAGYKVTYRNCEDDFIACAHQWKYLTIADINRAEREMDRAAKHAAPLDEEPPKELSPEDRAQASNWPRAHYKPRFALFRHLAERGWHPKFLVAEIAPNCGGGAETNHNSRPLALDVVILENLDATEANLQEVFGAEIKDKGLQIATRVVPETVQKLDADGIAIPSGGKVILPLRIIFSGEDPEVAVPNPEEPDADSQEGGRTLLELAQHAYRRLMSKPAGYIFRSTYMGDDGKQHTIRQKRESFRPPEEPEYHDFVFGPQWVPTAFRVEGRDLATGTDSYLVDLTELARRRVYQEPKEGEKRPEFVPQVSLWQNTEGVESCPILYGWGASEKSWVNYGKVIHTATGAANEATSVVRVDPQMRRFRLTEEEPEDAFIREVKLIVTLKDGRQLEFAPRGGPGPQGVRIPAYSKADFEFDVPSVDEAVGVVESRLVVTGYYVRHSALRTSALAGSHAKQSVTGR